MKILQKEYLLKKDSLEYFKTDINNYMKINKYVMFEMEKNNIRVKIKNKGGYTIEDTFEISIFDRDAYVQIIAKYRVGEWLKSSITWSIIILNTFLITAVFFQKIRLIVLLFLIIVILSTFGWYNVNMRVWDSICSFLEQRETKRLIKNN